MDHLLKMTYAIYPDIEIPYLCDGWTYSDPFETYPERLGFTRSDLINAPSSTQPATEVDKLLQALLFFGLLQTIFGSLFERNQFIRSNPTGQRIISTQHLRRMTVYFNEKRPDRLDPGWNKEWRNIRKYLVLANSIVVARQENCEALGRVQTPTQLLLTVLLQFLAKNLGIPDEVRRSRNLKSGLIENMMIERGWCRRQVAYLTESLHVESLYTLSRIERPDAHLRHSMACETVDCVANQVDRETYRTKHVCHDGSCAPVTANQEEMFNMLKSGHLPLIANRNYADRNDIKLLDTRSARTYVAVSHVWSHGLGNPRNNSLPKCQLARLNQIVNDLYGHEEEEQGVSVPYWIDTICCPTDPTEARALAILNLRKTYRGADKVLVLDANLEVINSAPLFVPEIALHISCSTWLTRLWTLQEGALAASIYFHFADRIIDLASIEWSLRYDRSCREFSDLLGGLYNFRHADQKDMGLPASGLIQFLHASVRNRSTSYASDEALCLATLAGLDMEDIARFEGVEDRMYEFWRLLRPAPSLMAFWSGPRMRTKGRRWGPRTLRGGFDLNLDMKMAAREEEEASMRGEKGAVITERGMMIMAPGLIFEAQEQDMRMEIGPLVKGEQFLVQCVSAGEENKENSWFHVRKTRTDEVSDKLSQLPPASSEACQTKTEGRGGHCDQCQYALILKRGKRLDVANYDEGAIDHQALLVSIEQGRPGMVIFSDIIYNVSINQFPGEVRQDPREVTGSAVISVSDRSTANIDHLALVNGVEIGSELKASGDKEKRLPVFNGWMLQDTQEWCIG
ncbi:uncharacterized protein Z518_10627 [Rhinocladiella mackenziei CBS 650.93]|uniref:Heterokaryon incompatibility domain-containing protein n=1 Tax=Rhinocladiella mackenziei CBS 650.93 TaxID=1442369 RepID=A0A0D2FEN0_9EURO|nr:uncharacterized protein Z518_10627 [Rhinocladiella mackenziei CBS 650.93]KIX00487.1 hypothetical protein Z518_10627 [Rhinocladiella mackenziei CBS 650.93]